MQTLDTSPLNLAQQPEIERAFISTITPTIKSLVDKFVGFINNIMKGN